MRQVSTRGSTALYDAVAASAVDLRNNPRLDKKVLLEITDGQDNMSRDALQEAMRQLQPSKGPTVIAIGLTEEGFTPTGREALQRLASTAGGVVFPEELGEVDAITSTVARDIRSQYTLSYKPGNPRTGYQDDSQSRPEHRDTAASRSAHGQGIRRGKLFADLRSGLGASAN